MPKPDPDPTRPRCRHRERPAYGTVRGRLVCFDCYVDALIARGYVGDTPRAAT